MKKLVCFVLALAMVAAVFPPSFAAEDSELAKVVKNAKGRLQIPEEFTEFYGNSYDNAAGKRYELRWSTEDSKKRINVSLFFDSGIVSYNYYDDERDYDRKGFAPFSKEEYEKIAREWLSRANPTYALELSDDCSIGIGNIYSNVVSVGLSREKDGIEVYGDYVSITLDKFTGDVLSMYSSWARYDEIHSPEGVITCEEAAKILGEKLGLTLRYHKLRDENRAVLMYTPKSPDMMIDAVTGEDFNVEYTDAELEEGNAGGGSTAGTMDSSNATKEETSLTEKEMEAVAELENLLAKEALTAIIRRMANTELCSLDVSSVDYRRIEIKGEMAYVATVRLNKGNLSGTVAFDAKTGELFSFSTYLPYKANKRQYVNFKRMEANALSFIRTWASSVAGKVKNFNENQNSEYFYFTRNENGIEYQENNINIRVDKETGKILSFSKNWEDGTVFDSPDGTITKEEAAAKYTSAALPELLYIANKIDRYASNNAEEFRLVYKFPDDAPSYIDAKTGAAYGWDMGYPQEENPNEYTLQKDLSGHWAEGIIKTLAENGVILSYEESFRPDEAITQKEFALLINCFEGVARPYAMPESEYGMFLRKLSDSGVIKKSEMNGNKKLSREETVAYLVRLFGYEDVAELRGIFKTGFSDEAQISADKIGYVAIAEGLGLVSGNGGKFSPKSSVTRAELAVMLYNALKAK